MLLNLFNVFLFVRIVLSFICNLYRCESRWSWQRCEDDDVDVKQRRQTFLFICLLPMLLSAYAIEFQEPKEVHRCALDSNKRHTDIRG